MKIYNAAALALFLSTPVMAKDLADCSGPILQLKSERCLSMYRGPRPASCMPPGVYRAPQWALDVLKSQGHGADVAADGRDLTLADPAWRHATCDKTKRVVTWGEIN
jgi:hypothetical protein